MSLQGDAGATAAAGDIVSFIERLLKTERMCEEAEAFLLQVKKHAEEIKESARRGWY